MALRKAGLCEQEQIHIPGAIQPHGAVIATRVDEWLITHASANLLDILGRSAESVLGRPLREAVGDVACHALHGIEPSNGIGPTAVQLTVKSTSGAPLHVRANRLGRQVCIDIEPADRDAGYRSPLLLTQPVLESFKHAGSRGELCDLAVRGLTAITGYDRVMVYRFNDAGDGDVVAEACSSRIDPCLGLRFPASDIPIQARSQYLRQRVGMVADAHYVPVPLIADPSLDDQLPVDMTYSQLRSVSPMHREFMRNMKTAASLTIALVDGEQLWGLLVCHHATPRVSGTELRAAANVIGQVVSLLYGSLKQAEISTLRLRRNTMLRSLVDRLANPVPLAEALAAVQAELLHLVDATGAVVRLSGSVFFFGRTPPVSLAEEAVKLMQSESGGEIVAVDDIGLRFPQFGDSMGEGCGALLLPLSYSSDDAILWFRPEQWQTVHWGGNPNAGGGGDLSGFRPVPRTSFSAWKQVLKHRPAPWTQADIAIAAEVARRIEAEIVRRTRAELIQAQDASRAKTRFLAGMTHELRTPLHGILGYAQLLNSEGGLNDLQSMRVQAMMGASTHLLGMINRVLEFSEIETEQVRLCPAECRLVPAASACLDVVRPAAEAKKLALQVVAAPGTPESIVTDPTRFRQILLNLMGNAVKFTSAGSVTMCLLPASTGAGVRIEVIDTGPGIPEAQRSRLFQDFDRLETECLSPIEGAGLGLALSARLASSMAGSIGFSPNPNGGSIFWLEMPPGNLPSAQPGQTAAVSPGQAETLPQEDEAQPIGTLNVLVVDDVPINRDIAASFLRAAGHAVTLVCSGGEAVTAAASADFDVILMDVRMPGVDGIEATRRIRAIAGMRGSVPIVALTAQAFADQVAECRKAGMQDHLAKPFSPDTLLAAVARAATMRHDNPPPSAAQASADSAAGSVLGLDLPVVDENTFARTIGYLSPEAVNSYLQMIMDLSMAFQARLNRPQALETGLHDLSEAAHTLAGSAGMFGFDRVANLGRRFERAAEKAAPDLQLLATSLDAAIETTLQALRAHRRP